MGWYISIVWKEGDLGMDYNEGVRACKEGLLVTDGVTKGHALRMVVLFGRDYISTDAAGKKNNIELSKAKIV